VRAARAVARGSWLRAGVLSVLVVTLAACGPDGPEASDPRALRGDGEALTQLLASDPAQPVLAELDGMIEDRLPVRAAGHIRTAALPAVRRQRERVGAVQLRTAEGRALQERAVRACRRRAESLEAYAAALTRGEVEDTQLLEAVRAHRAAELEVLAVLEAARALAQPGESVTPAGGAPPQAP
jgi:hypothetical protein